MRIFLILFVSISFYSAQLFAQDTLHLSYPVSVPTEYSEPPTDFPTCKASMTTTVPGNDSITVLSVMVSYSMSTDNGDDLSHQRSKIYCSNSDMSETNWAEGTNGPGSQFFYSRSLNIANGTYAGGEILIFEMWAQRIKEVIPGCNTSTQKVDAGSWNIDVIYTTSTEPTTKVGVNTTAPEAMLHVNGKLKIGDDSDSAIEGMLRYNNDTQDFEGFNGNEWLSLSNNENGNGSNMDVMSDDTLRWGLATLCENEISFLTYGTGVLDLIEYYPSMSNVVYDNGWAMSTMRDYPNGSSSQPDFTAIFKSDTDLQELSTVGNLDHTMDYPYAAQSSFGSGIEIFQVASDTWLSMQILTDPSSSSNTFGSSIDLNGDYLAVGTPGEDSNGLTNNGVVYIYKRTAGTWNLLTTLMASDQSNNANFGGTVDFNGNYLIVTATNKTQGNGTGGSYIFQQVGDQFNEVSIINPTALTFGEVFGQLLTITDDHAAISQGTSFNATEVFLYHNDNGTWAPSDTLYTPGSFSILNMQGNTLVAGSYIYNIIDGIGFPNSTIRNCNAFGVFGIGMKPYVDGNSIYDIHTENALEGQSSTFYFLRYDRIE